MDKIPYARPTVEDYGSIAEHTFTRAGGRPPKVGDWQVCKKDKFGEYSCPAGGGGLS